MATVGLFPSLVGAHLAGNAVTGISEMGAQSVEASSCDSFMTGPQPDILLGTYARGTGRLSGGGIRDMKAAIEALIDDLGNHNPESYEGLVAIGGPAVQPLIKRMYEDRTILPKICGILGDIRDPRGVEQLIYFLNHSSEDVIISAATALGEVGLPGAENAVEPLILLLQNGSSHVRCNAARALGHISDSKAILPLIKSLEDEEENPFVRCIAATALSDIDRPVALRTVEPLIKLLQNESSDVRFSTAKALGQIGDSRAVLPLIKFLEDEKEEWCVRCLAASALGEIGDPQALPHLEKTFGDQNDAVQIYAERAARKIRDRLQV